VEILHSVEFKALLTDQFHQDFHQFVLVACHIQKHSLSEVYRLAIIQANTKREVFATF